MSGINAMPRKKNPFIFFPLFVVQLFLLSLLFFLFFFLPVFDPLAQSAAAAAAVDSEI